MAEGAIRSDPLVPLHPFPLFVCEASPLGSSVYNAGIHQKETFGASGDAARVPAALRDGGFLRGDIEPAGQ
jgi:hypothetical protein